MSKVSRYPMDQDIEERMFDIFYQTLVDLKTKEQIKEFMTDLLSPTECIMLSKRLAIAVFFIKGYTYDYIRDTLKVSTSTILMISQWLTVSGEGFRKAVEKLMKKEKTAEFFEKIDEILENTIPPRRGSNWSRVRSQQWRDRMKRRKESIL